jgi:hypothetical protein
VIWNSGELLSVNVKLETGALCEHNAGRSFPQSTSETVPWLLMAVHLVFLVLDTQNNWLCGNSARYSWYDKVLFRPERKFAPVGDQRLSPRSLHDGKAVVSELAWLIRIAPDPSVGESGN